VNQRVGNRVPLGIEYNSLHDSGLAEGEGIRAIEKLGQRFRMQGDFQSLRAGKVCVRSVTLNVSNLLMRDAIERPATFGIRVGRQPADIKILRRSTHFKAHTGAERHRPARNRIAGRIDNTPMNERPFYKADCVEIRDNVSTVGLPTEADISIAFDAGKDPIHATIFRIEWGDAAAIPHADVFLDEALRSSLPAAKGNDPVWNRLTGHTIQKKQLWTISRFGSFEGNRVRAGRRLRSGNLRCHVGRIRSGRQSAGDIRCLRRICRGAYLDEDGHRHCGG
jgi:hypothetical protein